MAVTSLERMPFRFVLMDVGLNWYTLLVLVRTRFWSVLSSTFKMIGCRASSGRVSIIPTIVSAGPTITLSSSSSLKGFWSGGLGGAVILLHGQLAMTGAGVGSLVWCFGTGGAFVLGTWLSLLARAEVDRFSELRLRLRLAAT